MVAERIGEVSFVGTKNDGSPEANSNRPLTNLDIVILTTHNKMRSIRNHYDPNVPFSMSPEIVQQFQADIVEASIQLGLGNAAAVSSLCEEIKVQTGVEAHQIGKFNPE